mgnify:FL=1
MDTGELSKRLQIYLNELSEENDITSLTESIINYAKENELNELEEILKIDDLDKRQELIYNYLSNMTTRNNSNSGYSNIIILTLIIMIFTCLIFII